MANHQDGVRFSGILSMFLLATSFACGSADPYCDLWLAVPHEFANGTYEARAVDEAGRRDFGNDRVFSGEIADGMFVMLVPQAEYDVTLTTPGQDPIEFSIDLKGRGECYASVDRQGRIRIQGSQFPVQDSTK